MNNIIVEHNPDSTRIENLGITKWPTWSKEVSVFPWYFHEQEIAWIDEGQCVITPEDGTPVIFGKGDLVTFPAGMKCSWEVRQPLYKHYHLDGNVVTQAMRRVRALLPF